MNVLGEDAVWYYERDDGLEKVMRALAALIDPKCDDVRIYSGPLEPGVALAGAESLPKDVHLLIRRERGGVDRVSDVAVAPGVNSAPPEFFVNPVSKPPFSKRDSEGGVKPQT